MARTTKVSTLLRRSQVAKLLGMSVPNVQRLTVVGEEGKPTPPDRLRAVVRHIERSEDASEHAKARSVRHYYAPEEVERFQQVQRLPWRPRRDGGDALEGLDVKLCPLCEAELTPRDRHEGTCSTCGKRWRETRVGRMRDDETPSEAQAS